MALVGNGFYAMWNGMDPAHVPEFELMHARSHMPAHVAYLGVDGILAARRHGQGVGTPPPFFTLYDMRSLDVLTDPANQRRRVVESAWFLGLRPHYRDHIRHHCRVLARAGAGTAGSVATLLVRLSDAAIVDAQAAGTLCEALVARAPITAAHFGAADPTVPTLAGGSPPPRNQDEEPVGVLVVESHDRFALASELPAISRHVVDSGIATGAVRFAHYALSMAVEYGELPRWHAYERPPR